MPEPNPMTSPSRLWKTSRAAKRAALIGLVLVPVLMLLHPENIRQLIWLYSIEDWVGLAGTATGYLLGTVIGLSVTVALICGARNFVARLRFARRLGRFAFTVLCIIAAGIALCGLVAAIAAMAMIGNVLGGPQIASLSPLMVMGGGLLLWFLRLKWRGVVAAARSL
jgi:hypothetical protein